jgi:hypothetical protein
MPELFLERTFDPPIRRDDVLEMGRQGRQCFALHRVTWHGSHLATGGHRMVCRFSAADAESVRIALRTVGAATDRLWEGTVHDGPGLRDGGPAANVLIERSLEAPLAAEEIQAAEEHGWCAEVHRVTFVRTYVSTDRRRVLCLYRAPDAESVRLAQRSMKLPVDDLWAFTSIGPCA